MVPGNTPPLGKESREADELDQILDTAWAAFQKWEKEPGTRAHDAAERPLHLARSPDVSDYVKRRARLLSESGGRDTRSRTIKCLEQRVGENRWRELVSIFGDLPGDYELFVKRPALLLKAKKKLTKQCRDMADLMERENLEPQTEFFESPFHGLLAKQIFTIEWFWALQGLRFRCRTPKDAADVASRCFLGLYMTSPSKAISRILRGYAGALDTWKPGNREAAILYFAYGRLNKKEFVKRVVFFLLNLELNPSNKKGGAPNKETAAIVNAILGLRGQKSVKANNITQMNKKTRAKYHKDLESYVTRIKPQE